MRKTKAGVQEAFGLTAPPDDELMGLLHQLGEGEVVAGVAPLVGEGYTAEELEAELEEAVVGESVGDLLAAARRECGQSLRDVGSAAGLSHARVREVEQSSNVEISTVVRLARAMGYGVRIVLEPEPRGHYQARRRLSTSFNLGPRSESEPGRNASPNGDGAPA